LDVEENGVEVQQIWLTNSSLQPIDNSSWNVCPISTFTSFPTMDSEMKQALKQGIFLVHPATFKRILDFANVEPTLDVFSTLKDTSMLPALQRIPRHENPFSPSWEYDVLWLCPPFQHLGDVVAKILQDKSRGIILIPFWKHQPWFHDLQSIALCWLDFHHSDPVLTTLSGKTIVPKRDYLFRAVVFDTLHLKEQALKPKESQPSGFKEDNLPSQLSVLRSVDWECPSLDDITLIRSVIASTSQHPQAQLWVDKILRLYHSELHEPQLAKDVDPVVRGPFGIAKIELKESARPMARKPFRLGDREAPLRSIIDKYLERGWIRPSRR
jgi:hypothetical protein